jgi:hypothetical protein
VALRWFRNWQQSSLLARDWTFNLLTCQQGWTLKRTHLYWYLRSRPGAGAPFDASVFDGALAGLTWTEGVPPGVPVDIDGHFTDEDYLWYEMRPAVQTMLYSNLTTSIIPPGGGLIDSHSQRKAESSQGIIWFQASVFTPLSLALVNYNLYISYSILVDDGT